MSTADSTSSSLRPLLALSAALSLLLAAALPAAAQPGGGPPEISATEEAGPGDRAPQTVRFATYNTAFSDAYFGADDAGEFLADAASGDHQPMQDIALIIQHERPDVLQVGEFDYVGDLDGVDEYAAADAFRENYLEVAQGEQDPIEYEYAFVAPSNTGVDSGFDLDNSGDTGTWNDAWGFGTYQGQYGMLVLSKYPIVEDEIRTFQHFRWADMPGALLPSDPETDEEGDWYSDEILEHFPLSSKSHWDVPVKIGNHVVHTLNAHPTPPAFDGEEQRNVLRNHDEIRLWADYIHPARSGYIYDDDGGTGGLHPGASFVILGDYNADPCVGDSVPGAIEQLLDHPMVNDRDTPDSEGAPERHAEADDPPEQRCEAEPEFHTADFRWTARVDYALPSNNLQILDSSVFWPTSDHVLAEVAASSDHHLVSVDLRIPTRGSQ